MACATGPCMRCDTLRAPFTGEHVCEAARRLYAGKLTFHAHDAEIADGVTVHRSGGHSMGLQAVRVRTRAANWVEVVTNRADGRTAWVARDRVEVIAWPDVLLASLLSMDPEANPLRTRPTDSAPILATVPEGWRLRPLAIRGDWVQVSTLGLADRIPPSGWVRWTDGSRLLVHGIGQE